MTNLHVRVYYNLDAPLYSYNVQGVEARPQVGDKVRIDTESASTASDARVLRVAWRSDFKVLDVDIEIETSRQTREAIETLAAALKWTPITNGKDTGDSAVPEPTRQSVPTQVR